MRARTLPWMVALAAAFTLSQSAAADDKPVAEKPAEKTLYERLGGVYPIAVVIDDFLDRVVDDSVLNANPKIKEARDRVPKAGLKYRITELVCMVTGGPCKYSGRSMKETHASMGISEKEWQALEKDFKTSLDRFKVPEKEQGELIAIVRSTKKDIVAAAR